MKKLLLLFTAFVFAGSVMSQVVFSVETPQSIQGSYQLTYADGADWTAMPDLLDPNNAVLDTLVQYLDATDEDSLGCMASINEADLEGNIAVLYRGGCQFGTKALNAQEAGAVALVIINNQPGDPIGMAAADDGAAVSIPVVMITDVDGALVMETMANETVTAFIGNKTGYYPNDIGISNASVNRPLAFTMNQMLTDNFEFTPAAWIYNYGFNEQTNVNVRAVIEYNGNEIYNEVSTDNATIASDDSAYISLPIFTQAEFENGLYNVTYTLESDSTDIDDFDFDNEATADFAFADDFWTISQVDENLELQSPGGVRTLGDVFEACVTFRDPNASRVAIESLTFSAYTSGNSGLSLDGIPMNVSLKRWDNVFTDIDDLLTQDLNITELDNVEFFFDGDLQGENVTADFTEPIVLLDNQNYLVCVSTFEPEVYIGFDGETSYEEANRIPNQPMNPLVTDGQMSVGGFVSGTVPAFSVNLVDAATIGLEKEQLGIRMIAYPSPASYDVSVDFQGHDVASVEVVSLTGQRVAFQDVANGQTETTVDVNGLENGLYIFNVTLTNGLTKKLNVVVSH